MVFSQQIPHSKNLCAVCHHLEKWSTKKGLRIFGVNIADYGPNNLVFGGLRYHHYDYYPDLRGAASSDD
jgi:hypothetical protein